MAEATYQQRYTDVGQVAPVTLEPQDFQAAPPAPVGTIPCK